MTTDENQGTYIILMILVLVTALISTFVIVKFFMIHNEEREQLSSAVLKNIMDKQYKSQSQLVFDSLEEGILLVQDDAVTFMNNEFKNVLTNFQG